VPEAASGVYAVADAGTVTLVHDGDRIDLTDVQPNGDWQTGSIEGDEDEADVEFQRGEEDLDFEADVDDDGRLEIQVCDDED
jgi:hypothetical protein